MRKEITRAGIEEYLGAEEPPLATVDPITAGLRFRKYFFSRPSSLSTTRLDRLLLLTPNPLEYAGLPLRNSVIEIIYWALTNASNPGPIYSDTEASMAIVSESLPHLRFEITEAARILRISRATL